ncbi:MAG: sulfurtransferase [Pigmentiphaga sp.]|jgi:thiosulfate/3-mercaptopyruvate sulfurtransferase|uniref:sulfurtransferase n=1 Tax=Pigmentiphaga sp. TaxID=1977564 RepID=UPI003B57D8BA
MDMTHVSVRGGHAFEPAFVQAEDLLARPNDDRLFVDVRLGDPEIEYRAYRDGHIFGAVHGQIRDAFAAEPTPASGNLPLPGLGQLADTLRNWGVGRDTEIVVYGPTPALAARGWWVLRWAGLARVFLLDGGLKAWIAAGGALARGDESHRRRLPEVLSLAGGHLPQIEVDEVERLPDGAVLVDARDEASYLAGHIPGARHLAASEFWTPSGRLRPAGERARLLAQAGLEPGDEAVVYCGGGVLSALVAMAMADAGIRPRLYVGSWSEWNKDPERMRRSAVGERA